MLPATKSQAENGVDNKTYMTPLRTKQAILANKSGGGSGTSNYNDLEGKPKINNVTLEGNKTSSELGITGDKDFTYIKNTPDKIWEITHNLDKYPSVTIVDSAGSVVMGDITYTSKSALTVTFSAAFSGKAYLN